MFYITLLIITTISKIVNSQDISPLIDIKTLSELPLEKLLKVKSTFEENDKLIEKEEIQSKLSDYPEALALKSNRPHDRGGYYHGHERVSKKSDKKHIQSIFQTSVTTLAFLAFGGYLLCLLVQALRSKSMPTVTTMSPEVMAVIANLKRKPIRKRPVKFQRPKPYRNNRPKRDIWPETDPNSMYYAFVSLSEAYANYHTINYKKLNNSVNNFYW